MFPLFGDGSLKCVRFGDRFGNFIVFAPPSFSAASRMRHAVTRASRPARLYSFFIRVYYTTMTDKMAEHRAALSMHGAIAKGHASGEGGIT